MRENNKKGMSEEDLMGPGTEMPMGEEISNTEVVEDSEGHELGSSADYEYIPEYEEEQEQEQEKENSEDTEESRAAKAKRSVFGIVMLVVLLGVTYFIYSDEKATITPGAEKPNSVKIDETTENIPEGSMKVVRVSPVEDLRPEVGRTLKEINTAAGLSSTVFEMRKDFDEMRSLLESREKSTRSLEKSQSRIIESIGELHRLTSSEEIQLEDGGLIMPHQNGIGYTLVSSSDITTKTDGGVYIIMSNGYIVKNSESSIIYFAFTNPRSENIDISDLYKVSPIHGLVQITNSEKEREDILKEISKLGSKTNDRVSVRKFTDEVIFFNSVGEIAATKRFKRSKKEDKLKNKIKESTVRSLTGFETKDLTKYELLNKSLFKDGKMRTIYGYSQDLTIRYSEYKGTKEEEGGKYVEILAEEEGELVVIKRHRLKKIERIYLTKTVLNEVTFISKNGKIYELSEFGTSKLIGEGKIIGQLDKEGNISKEKMVLLEKAIKYSPLNQLANMTLIGINGDTYKVKKDYLVMYPNTKNSKIEEVDKFLMSSKGKLLLKENHNFVDQILKIKSSDKIGGRIISENYIIEITSLNKAIVYEKATDVTKTYNNPKVKFEEGEWISLYASADYELDEKNKTINGIKYVKKIKEGPLKYRFVGIGGVFISPRNPDFDFSKKLILKERVNSVEKIEGDAFDYLYTIDNKTGEISSKGLGKLISKQKGSIESQIFNPTTKEKSFGEKKIEVSQKSIYTLDELIYDNKHITKVLFKTLSGDSFKIISGNAILLNKQKIMLKSGKYNLEMSIFVFELDDSIDNRTRKTITNDSRKTRFERAIKEMTNESENYYNEDYLVVTVNNNKVIRLFDIDGLETWTTIYAEEVDLKKKELELTIKPTGASADTSRTRFLKLSSIKEMGHSMKKDVQEQYKDYITAQKIEKPKTRLEQVEIDNTNILEAELAQIKAQIASLNGVNLSMKTFTMSKEELEETLEKETESTEFKFEIGTEFTYNIPKSVEITEGEIGFINTKLDQTFFEDREGNTVDMIDPLLVLQVEGDFNTNKVIFRPSLLVYTSSEGKRQTVTIPGDSTILEYKEEGTDFVLSGVPAFYVNQKVKELPTTVMLSTLQGVVESMAGKDEGFGGALAGLEGLGGTGDDKTGEAFTEGVASGAADGIGEILEVYKAKSEGKQDILITVGDIDLKSIFIKTTDLNIME